MPPKTTPRDKNFRRGKDRYNKRRATAMKKVTAKGAYKPKVKKQMIKRRAPLVETKQRDTASIALINGHPVLKKDVNGITRCRTTILHHGRSRPTYELEANSK